MRIRPPLKQIHNDNVDNSLCLEVSSPSSLIIATKPEPKQFSYDHVAGMDTTQVFFHSVAIFQMFPGKKVVEYIFITKITVY